MTERLEEIKEDLIDEQHMSPETALWLINRVEELEEHTKTLESDLNKEVQHNNYLHKKNRRYKQALEFYADESNYEFETIVSDCDIDIEAKILDDGGEKARQGLKGESQ